MPALGIHLLAMRRTSGCPVGTAVAALGVALDMIRSRGIYQVRCGSCFWCCCQGSLKDSGNLVYALILTAQEKKSLLGLSFLMLFMKDTVNSWVATKSNWSVPRAVR